MGVTKSKGLAVLLYGKVLGGGGGGYTSVWGGGYITHQFGGKLLLRFPLG